MKAMNTTRFLSTLILSLGCLFISPLGTGANLSAQQNDPREAAIRKLLQSTVMINQMYVDTVNIDRQIEDAITGMLTKLDPHSQYTNAADTKKLNEPLKGNFEGIGVQFNIADVNMVIDKILSTIPVP